MIKLTQTDEWYAYLRDRSSIALVVFVMITAVLGGCATVDRGVAVPRELTTEAAIPGYEDIRYSHGESEHRFRKEFIMAIKAGRALGTRVNILAISGGGADGAFGAGLLSGWTARGDRPEFQIVTGVSTGALTSPFAFLGSEYDDQLHTAYTTLHDEDVFRTRNIFAIIRGDSFATTGPLYQTISNYIDETILRAVAREHARGRRLFILTTNLDTQRPVVWNMGAIAASGREDALDLFRRIIIASASIPVAFPPQYIEVSARGENYTEMHVDGGLMDQVFLHLPTSNLARNKSGNSDLRVYVIRNSKVAGEYSAMTAFIIPIVTRTIASLVKSQGLGDLFEIYEQTQEAGAEYRLAFVPDDMEVDHHDMFDPEAMKKMFDEAFSMARDGYPWRLHPPEEF